MSARTAGRVTWLPAWIDDVALSKERIGDQGVAVPAAAAGKRT